jgi:chromosomal replication initiator protein
MTYQSVSELTQLWDRVLAKLSTKINDRHIYDSFFGSSFIHSINGDAMVVVVNSGLASNILSTQYYDLIHQVILEATQSDFKMRFVQEQDVNKMVKKDEKKPPFFEQSLINKKLSFDSYVVGTSNREASQAALMIASNPGKLFNYNPLFVYSQSGLGKTHLLHAIGNYIRSKRNSAKVLYLTTDDFFEDYFKSIKEREVENLKDRFREIDFLLLDDVQFL